MTMDTDNERWKDESARTQPECLLCPCEATIGMLCSECAGIQPKPITVVVPPKRAWRPQYGWIGE